MKKVEMIGQRFGRLIVLKKVGREKWGDSIFLCKCDCGKDSKHLGKNLRKNISQSCGCYKLERVRNSSSTHKDTKTNFYGIYCSLKSRCNNSNYKAYSDYGGRGIQCLWLSYEEFKQDMFEEYNKHILLYGRKNTSIERINNDGNYCKENCKWDTKLNQARNRRNSSKIFFQGKTATYAEWAEITGINALLLRARIIKLKWSIEKALTVPIR